MTAQLTAQILTAERQYQRLGELMAELNAAQRHGNVSRIGNAIHDAEMAGFELQAALAAAYGTAWDLERQRNFAPASNVFTLPVRSVGAPDHGSAA